MNAKKVKMSCAQSAQNIGHLYYYYFIIYLNFITCQLIKYILLLTNTQKLYLLPPTTMKDGHLMICLLAKYPTNHWIDFGFIDYTSILQYILESISFRISAKTDQL